MRQRTRDQIQKEYRNQLITAGRKVAEERKQESFHRHWQEFRDAQREARDFYRNFS